MNDNSYTPLLLLPNRTIELITDSSLFSSSFPLSREEFFSTIIWANQKVDASDDTLRDDDFYTWSKLSLEELTTTFWPLSSMKPFDGGKLIYNPHTEDLAQKLSTCIFTLTQDTVFLKPTIDSIHNSIELAVKLIQNATKEVFTITSSHFIIEQGLQYTLSNLVYWFNASEKPTLQGPTPFFYRVFFAHAELTMEKYTRNKALLKDIIPNIDNYIEKLHI